MNTPHEHPAADARRLRRCFSATLLFTAVLWLVKLVEVLFNLELGHLGVYPRTLPGLVGIVFAPLVHGSLLHLFHNTLPVMILGTALLYGYPRSARVVIPVVYFGTGIAVWLFARSAWHIGASGLTFGVMFFIFTIGILRWDTRSIALAMVVFLLYGGMIWGVVPGDPSVSFESHLAGAVLGVILAFALKDRDPPSPARHYSWEDEEEKDALDASQLPEDSDTQQAETAPPPRH
jgi:membrane associated rhomboid family serine protease